MLKLKNAVDILKLLEKSNCRDCGQKTCMAFAAMVFNGQMKLDQCPRLDPAVIEQYTDQITTRRPSGQDAAEFLKQQQEKVKNLDLPQVSDRLGVRYDGRRLVVPVLGRNIYVDPLGSLSSDIHLNPWVVGPLLHLLLHGAGAPVTGHWVQFRDLAGGPERLGLFDQRAVKPLRQAADLYDDLFNDMLEVFSAVRDYNRFESDISIILYPLPRVPILVCYWKPSEGMESDLNLFFDASADANIGAEGLFSLCAGLAVMFDKLARTHGAAVKR